MLWLVISVREPGPSRAVLEWLGATHLYVALGALFLRLVLDARADGSTLGQVAFGFLLLVFGLGFVVSLVKTLAAVGRSGEDAGSGGAVQ